MTNADKTLFIDTAIDDAEWHLGPIVQEAYKVWETDKDEVIGLHDHLRLAESNEPDDRNDNWLEDFMTQGMKLWGIGKYAAKVLFDVCSTLDNREKGRLDLSVTVDHGDFKETITGISFQKAWCTSIIALVWDDDTVPEIIYGYDVPTMRTSIDALYQFRFNRPTKQHRATFSRRI